MTHFDIPGDNYPQGHVFLKILNSEHFTVIKVCYIVYGRLGVNGIHEHLFALQNLC